MKDENVTIETVVVLPDEVKELALRVPEVKQKEVQTVLSQIFAGTADWKKQAESIVVKDIHDNLSIQMAEAGRKNVKTARLAAEKIFDAKRDEVQQKKSEFDLEDKLWLKAKQTAQILFKDIESTFEWKAKFVERYEAEQKELITQLRIEKVSKYSDDINRIALENMSDQIFDMFLSGLEKAFNDRLEAERKAEESRLAEIEAEKKRQEEIRLENERLKKEAEAKEKALIAEREKIRKENEEKERLAEIERQKQAAILKAEQDNAAKERAELLAKAEAERKEKERLEAQMKAKKEAEEKAQREASAKIEAEKKAKVLAEKKAKLAPDRDKLLIFMQAINDLPRPEVTSIEAANIAANANTLLVKVANYIKENIDKL
jgi:hypothetical protein